VEALHARLRQDETGAYILSDEGSVAGTWVNYAPISTGGIRLEHGDILHIGRVIFRFSLLKPPPALQPRIETYTDTL
jgi:predicted component of type VI protein secretion system